MLPVSGAEQLNTSADHGTRPMISHSGAYSRLVSPAPDFDCGRNRFQRPSARACALSASINRIGCHRSPSATSRAWHFSLGWTLACMNASRRAASSWVRAECSNAMASSCARCLVGMLVPVRRSAPAEDLLDLLPTTLRHVPGRASRLDSVRAGRDAVERASHDALGDAGGAEHVVRDIKVPLIGIDRPAFDAAAVCGHVVEFRGYPE